MVRRRRATCRHPPRSGNGQRAAIRHPHLPADPAALDAFAGTPVLVGAQDVSQYGPGPYTGEITADELAEIGIQFAEIGHAERRRLFGETDTSAAAKTAAAIHHGITPVLCIGETEELGRSAAVLANLEQLATNLDNVPAGPVIVAYEPVWAIGATWPAPYAHIAAVTRALRVAVAAVPARAGSVVIYGGSAGPGLLGRIGNSADGLFLGRFAHDPDALLAVLDEAHQLARSRSDPALTPFESAEREPSEPKWRQWQSN